MITHNADDWGQSLVTEQRFSSVCGGCKQPLHECPVCYYFEENPMLPNMHSRVVAEERRKQDLRIRAVKERERLSLMGGL